MAPVDYPERRRRIRKTALICGLIALAFYLGYIVLTVVQHSP